VRLEFTERDDLAIIRSKNVFGISAIPEDAKALRLSQSQILFSHEAVSAGAATNPRIN
jgi:hypothetical protein